jgi:hypothetical protein
MVAYRPEGPQRNQAVAFAASSRVKMKCHIAQTELTHQTERASLIRDVLTPL